MDRTQPLPGDLLMRKAAEFFAQEKFAKAYEHYGLAVQSYVTTPAAAPERIALAFYTRSILITRGHVEGNLEANIDQGEKTVLAAPESAPVLRFRGLFAFLRGALYRSDKKWEAAEMELQRALLILTSHGTPVDLIEVERELARTAKGSGRSDEAIERATSALSRASTPEQRLWGRQLLEEIRGTGQE